MNVKDEADRLDASVHLRLKSEEKEQLKHDADVAGLSMSELIRRQYFSQTIRSRADDVMINELRRLGGLLKHTHNITGGTHFAQTASILTKLEDFVDRLE